MWEPTVDEVLQLYERYCKSLEATHWGQYLALAPDGRYIVGEDDVAVVDEALQQFGAGNFVLLRVGEIAAYKLRRTGFVSSHRYPFLKTDWQVGRHRERSWAYADTGFEGALCIPADRHPLLGPTSLSVQLSLADASTQIQPTYRGIVSIVGIDEPIPAIVFALGAEFLLGRRILDRYRVTFDRGQQLIVERL